MRGRFAWLGAAVVLLGVGAGATIGTQDTWLDGYGVIAYVLVPLAFIPFAAGAMASPRANRFVENVVTTPVDRRDWFLAKVVVLFTRRDSRRGAVLATRAFIVSSWTAILKASAKRDSGRFQPMRAFTTVLVASGLVLTVFGGVARAQEKKGETLQLKDLPPSVQKTVQDNLKGGAIKTIGKEKEDGIEQYEIETTINGKARDFNVAVDGRLQGRARNRVLAPDLACQVDRDRRNFFDAARVGGRSTRVVRQRVEFATAVLRLRRIGREETNRVHGPHRSGATGLESASTSRRWRYRDRRRRSAVRGDRARRAPSVTPRSSPQLWSRRGVSPGSPKSLLRSKYLDHHGAYPGLGCAAR